MSMFKRCAYTPQRQSEDDCNTNMCYATLRWIQLRLLNSLDISMKFLVLNFPDSFRD